MKGVPLPPKKTTDAVKGQFTFFGDEQFYAIENYDHLPPFFMSIISGSNHWNFLSSTGGLTAGRINSENAIFPYYTEDKIAESAATTGSLTILRIREDHSEFIWEPLSDRYPGLYEIKRTLYKNVTGTKVVFEEINTDLDLTFRTGWTSSEKYGVVKFSSIVNNGAEKKDISLLDGVQNIIPAGTTSTLQNEFSSLLDGYKKNELYKRMPLGIYKLSSILTDMAEPREALRCTTAWTAGLDNCGILLCSRQLNSFRSGEKLATEEGIRGQKGSFLIYKDLSLDKSDEKEWFVVLDVEQDQEAVSRLAHELWNSQNLIQSLLSDIEAGTARLRDIVGSADGLEATGDELTTTHHFANVMFNVMRGGTYLNGYTISPADFLDFLKERNKPVYDAYAAELGKMPASVNLNELKTFGEEKDDTQLTRLILEYLPLFFSRRHGDPSRPWNKFSIELKDNRGKEILNFQGNWRDIFQNWEALSLSYPEYIESIIAKFVNATTFDGYNPYRITRSGLDWEEPEPENPWANIGYWGDHQIVYLGKLLEWSEKFHGKVLENFMKKDLFTYADIPYRIAAYDEIIKDYRNTIDFDFTHNEKIMKRVAKMGTDGRLLHNENDQILHVNLTEKILTLLMAKLSNFIPGGGIWMNTQRPEWNDANNALVGPGLSMVTLSYLRRFISHCLRLVPAEGSVEISKEVFDLFVDLFEIFHNEKPAADLVPDDRRRIVDMLGTAGSRFRKAYYEGLAGKKDKLDFSRINEFFTTVLLHIDQTLKFNKRQDNLYHSYNLLIIEKTGGLVIRNLYEMLEGQVAILSSGLLTAGEAKDVLTALKKSRLYRKDQHSYILYPDRDLPTFENMNTIPEEDINKSPFLKNLLNQGDSSIVTKDADNRFHFHSDFQNAEFLKKALEGKSGTADAPTSEDIQYLLDLYENIFDHNSFTGRSGTFFAYEGLGSIYWHMVSKLLLAAQENYDLSLKGSDKKISDALRDAYFDIRSGIGFNKEPSVYGSFPTDPYSHTPGHKGAQQPGMTGQVKEEVITRLREKGFIIDNGRVYFSADLLRKSDFLSTKSSFNLKTASGEQTNMEIPAGSLAFTFCQTPVVISLGGENQIIIEKKDGSSIVMPENIIDGETSLSMFQRNGDILKVAIVVDGKTVRD